MRVLQGLSDGQVLQRGEKGCDIRFKAKSKGELRVSQGEITPLGGDVFRLAGIPAGGPYRLTLTDDDTPFLYPYRYLSEIRPEGNRVLLTVEDGYAPAKRACVWYGAGFNTVCTITDGAGRPLSAFGPVKVL